MSVPAVKFSNLGHTVEFERCVDKFIITVSGSDKHTHIFTLSEDQLKFVFTLPKENK